MKALGVASRIVPSLLACVGVGVGCGSATSWGDRDEALPATVTVARKTTVRWGVALDADSRDSMRLELDTGVFAPIAAEMIRDKTPNGEHVVRLRLLDDPLEDSDGSGGSDSEGVDDEKRARARAYFAAVTSDRESGKVDDAPADDDGGDGELPDPDGDPARGRDTRRSNPELPDPDGDPARPKAASTKGKETPTGRNLKSRRGANRDDGDKDAKWWVPLPLVAGLPIELVVQGDGAPNEPVCVEIVWERTEESADDTEEP